MLTEIRAPDADLLDIFDGAAAEAFAEVEAERLRAARGGGHTAEWDACAADAAHFICRYVKIDEPQGDGVAIVPFELWPRQVEVLAQMAVERLIVCLKARQLGITWLACAYALWLCLFQPGRVVLCFSKSEDEAKELVRRFRVMYQRLPDWLRLHMPVGELDNTTDMSWANGSRVQARAATKSAGRTYTASLVIMDEAAFMQWGQEVYTSIKPTVDGGGKLLVVSTANGETGFFHDLWEKAVKGLNAFVPIFLNWRARPDRTDEWRVAVAADAVDSRLDLQEYPDTPKDAFQATGAARFLPSMALYDACKEDLPPLGKREPAVIALDAGVTNDHFGLLVISRHPARHDDVAVRYVQEWIPPKGGQIDFQGTEDAPGPERMVRLLCANYNIVCVTYDPHELRDLCGRLNKEGIAWFEEFSQGAARLEADKQLFDLIVARRFAHDGNAALRAHVANADRKVDAESRKLRLVKREDALKIDLAVCASMASYKCLELNL